MFTQFLTKKSTFFSLFNQLAELLLKGMDLLDHMVHQQGDLVYLEKQITQVKNEGKNLSHILFTDLHKVFITPFDRHDIHALNSQINDAINLTNSTAQRFVCYQLDAVPSEMLQLSELSKKAAALVKVVVESLNNLKNSELILVSCQEIKKYESDADLLRLHGVAALLMSQAEPTHIMKMSEIYTLLESITDRYQKIAYLAEGIILEYA